MLVIVSELTKKSKTRCACSLTFCVYIISAKVRLYYSVLIFVSQTYTLLSRLKCRQEIRGLADNLALFPVLTDNFE